MVYAIVVAACWVTFLVYWLVASTKAKSDAAQPRSWWTAFAIRVIVVLVAIPLLRLPAARSVLQSSRAVFSFSNPTVGIISSALSVLGVAIAVWARTCLGANWSPRPSVKVDHELVTSGPYQFVRHPIYAGMLLALLGTTLDAGAIGLVIFVCVAVVLGRRIAVEERLMLRTFPEQYPLYRNHTKALIPYVL